MNKIRQILSSYKIVGFVILVVLIILTLWFWLKTKSRESIKEHQFVIAADSRWFPLDLHGQEQYMVGFVSELTQAIAKDEEIKIQVVPVGTSQLLDNLEKGYYDGIFSSLSPDILNEEKYHFSETFYLTGPVLIVPFNSKATSISELHTVGIKRGVSSTFAFYGAPITSILPIDNMNVGLSELVMGKIDGIIMDSVDAYAYIQGYYAGKLKVVTPPLNNEGLRLLTLNNFFGKALVEIFDQGLEKVKEDNNYQRLLERWDLINPETAHLPK